MNFTCLDFYNDKLARALILKSAMACCMQAVGSRVLAEILCSSFKGRVGNPEVPPGCPGTALSVLSTCPCLYSYSGQDGGK